MFSLNLTNILVMLGLFGVQTGTTNMWYSKNNKFEQAWQKIIKRLKWVFGGDVQPRAVMTEFNRFRGLGVELTPATYATTCTAESNTSMDLIVQYDHIGDRE